MLVERGLEIGGLLPCLLDDMRPDLAGNHIGENDQYARALEWVEPLERAVARVATEFVEDARIERDEAVFISCCVELRVCSDRQLKAPPCQRAGLRRRKA